MKHLFFIFVIANIAFYSIVKAQTGPGNIAGHTKSIDYIKFSPNGKTVLTYGYGGDNTVKLWDLNTENVILTVTVYMHYNHFAGFTSDGNFFYITDDKQTKLINTNTLKETWSRPCLSDLSYDVRFSKDGKKLILLYPTKIGYIDIETGNEEFASCKLETVDGFYISPNDNILIQEIDKKFHVWDLFICKELYTLESINQVQFSPDGKYIAAISTIDKSAKFWDALNGKLLYSKENISSIVFSSDGKYVGANTTTSKSIKLWHTSNGNLLNTIENENIYNYWFAPDSKGIYFWKWDGDIYYNDISTRQTVKKISTYIKYCLRLIFSPDKKTFATPNESNGFSIYDIETGKEIKKITGIKIEKPIIQNTDKYILKNGEYEYTNEKITGKGMIVYPDKTKYVGELVNDLKEGKGAFYNKQTIVYDGDWKNDKREGQGIEWLPNKYVYDGTWKNNKLNGFAYYRNQNGGVVYMGNFIDGEMTGKGKYYYEDGSMYEGDFMKGKRHGQGSFYNTSLVYEKSGTWENDVFISHDERSKQINNIVDKVSVNENNQNTNDSKIVNKEKDQIVIKKRPAGKCWILCYGCKGNAAEYSNFLSIFSCNTTKSEMEKFKNSIESKYIGAMSEKSNLPFKYCVIEFFDNEYDAKKASQRQFESWNSIYSKASVYTNLIDFSWCGE